MLYTETYGQQRKPGLSGVMRVRNEARMIESCIDSVIDALDELIVVCNDCTDDTPAILERKVKQYPNKLRVFTYNHKVLSFEMSDEEYELALTLPDDSPRLYCNQCNYGLAQARFSYVVKIDTDQNYFEAEVKKLRDICAKEIRVKWNFCLICGWIFMVYFTLYRRVSTLIGTPQLWMVPDWLISLFYGSYERLAQYKLSKGTAAISLSGVNLFKDEQWFVPCDIYNAHFPYNGSGDTVIFKLSEKTFFTRYPNKVYNSVTEHFNHPYKVMYTGPVWFHQHANRVQCWGKVKNVKDKYPEMFVTIGDFLMMSYKDIHKKMGESHMTLHSRILFALIHKVGKGCVKRNVDILKRLDDINLS